MSVSEPNISGKVILKTTLGDIEIELWGKETPLTTRNFVQLCLEGYYDGCIFHRMIKDFIAQTGDPTNTGTGGESVYEETEIQDSEGELIKSTAFKDEFHSRLRFNRRGMVGMASSSPDQNKSQFFFTLAKTENLTKKHTVFGRVAGDTLFNLLKVNDLEVDSETDLPLFPPKIISTNVVWNPFPDIIPRVKTIIKKKVEKKKQTKKNLNLLSFGDEENEGEFDNSKIILNNNISKNNNNNNNNNKNNIKLNNISKEIKNSGGDSGGDSGGYNSDDGSDNNKKQLKNNLEIMTEAVIENNKKGEDVDELKNLKNEIDSSTLPKLNTTTSKTSTTTTTTTTTTPPPTEQVKQSVDKKKKIKGSLQFKTTTTPTVPKKSRSISETDLLNKLNSFKNSLNSKPSNIKRSIEEKEEDEEDNDWMSHSLKFSKKSKLEYE
ncbi:hypothetical protein ACTFIY_010876 [Dictyostelium cf. discoideum]